MTPTSQAGISKAYIPLLLVLTIASIIVLRSGFIFLLLAILPSLVAYYIDVDQGKPAFKIVAACNFAATMPSLAPMIHAGIKMKRYDITDLMGNPTIWLFVYMGAAAGWCLIFMCKLVGRLFATMYYEQQIAALERAQKRLVEEWGNLVTSDNAVQKAG